MAHSPLSQPDPFDAVANSVESEGSGEPGSAQSLPRWVKALSDCGGGVLAADLALDLVLNDIVERARAATGATAAAIALSRNGEIVCRATTGENAPGLGVPLNTDSGLSAACVQTRTWQRCDDTEADPRVDADACRLLGVRSILVSPILDQYGLLGIIETFASHVHAFGNRAIATLEVLSREIVDSVHSAAGIGAASPKSEEGVPDASLESLQPTVLEKPRRGLGTGALFVLVVVVALILGWMVGRSGRRSVASNAGPHDKVLTPLSPIVAPAAVPAVSQPNQDEPTFTSGGGGETANDGLVIYQRDKVIFRTPSQSQGKSSRNPTGEPVQRAAERTALSNQPLHVSPEIAKEYLVKRIEPEYPEQARQRRIQGLVVIDVLVSKEGAVEGLTAIRGAPVLVDAAMNAIRQWQFQPFFRNGLPEEFQTRVTVDFRLP